MRPAGIKLLIRPSPPRSQPRLPRFACRFQTAWKPGRGILENRCGKLTSGAANFTFHSPSAIYLLLSTFKSPQIAALCILSRVYTCILVGQTGWSVPTPPHSEPTLREGFEQVAMRGKGGSGDSSTRTKAQSWGRSTGSGDKNNPFSLLLCHPEDT